MVLGSAATSVVLKLAAAPGFMSSWPLIQEGSISQGFHNVVVSAFGWYRGCQLCVATLQLAAAIVPRLVYMIMCRRSRGKLRTCWCALRLVVVHSAADTAGCFRH
jgi:hypothetical protein